MQGLSFELRYKTVTYLAITLDARNFSYKLHLYSFEKLKHGKHIVTYACCGCPAANAKEDLITDPFMGRSRRTQELEKTIGNGSHDYPTKNPRKVISKNFHYYWELNISRVCGEALVRY